MSRRYTPEAKRQALAWLEANGANYAEASTQTGIPANTLRRWHEQQLEAQAQSDVETLHCLRRKLIDGAHKLAASLDEVLAEAPLNQRAGALGIVIDRYLKLGEALPQEAQEQVIRIEYKYPDGSIHSVPPWARQNSGGDSPLPRRGLWQTLWENRNGQSTGHPNGAEGRAVLVADPDLSDGQPGLAGSESDVQERLWDEP